MIAGLVRFARLAVSAALAGAAVALSVSLSLAADDEAAHERGRELFSRCERCHELDPLRGNRIGPNLYNVVGRPAAAQMDFRYSQGMRDAAAGGLQWTPEQIDQFIADPRSVVRRTSMSFRGIDDPAQRADIIAFLSTVGPQDLAAHQAPTGPAGTEIGSGAMSIEGDPAYGEYLASECVTCHQRSGTDEGIPGIVGWPREDFIRALFEYKSNVRSHPVMQMITSNLGDEEVAALAAYFNKLGAN